MAEQRTNDLSLGNSEPPAPKPQIVTDQASGTADGLNVPVDPAAFATTGERHESAGTTLEMPPAPVPGPTPGFDPKKEKEQPTSGDAPREPRKPSHLRTVGFAVSLIAALAIGYVLGSQRPNNATSQQPSEQQSEASSSSDASGKDNASDANENDADQSDSQQSSSASNEDDENASASNDASDSSSTSASSNFDVSTLAGEKWSNAKKILTSNDIDLDDVIVLTNDGKQVVVDSNWSVEDAYRRGKSITVELKHDTDAVKDAGDGFGRLLDSLTSKQG